MNCQGAENLFIEYLYGELEPHQAESMRAHLDRCGTCAARLAELARVRELAATAPDPEPPRLTINRVIARAREEAERPRSLWTFKWVKVLAPVCLAMVVGGLVAYQLRIGLAPKPVAYTPAGEEQRQSAPTQDAEKKETHAPAGNMGKEALPAPSRAAKEPPSQREKGAAPAPGPSPPSPGPSVARESAKQALPPDAERGKVMQAPGAPAAESAVSAPAALLSTRKEVPALPGAGVGKAKVDAAPLPQTVSPAEKALTDGGNKRDGSVPKLLSEGEQALEAGSFGDAGQLFSRALDLLPPGHPDRPRALFGLARAQEGQRDLAGALRTYRELAKESPTHRELAEGKMKELSGAGVK